MQTDNQKKRSDKKPQPSNNLNQYARYSGLAFQMLAAILVGIWLGMRVDKWMGNESPVFTAIFAVIFILASLYLLIRSLPKS